MSYNPPGGGSTAGAIAQLAAAPAAPVPGDWSSVALIVSTNPLPDGWSWDPTGPGLLVPAGQYSVFATIGCTDPGADAESFQAIVGTDNTPAYLGASSKFASDANEANVSCQVPVMSGDRIFLWVASGGSSSHSFTTLTYIVQRVS